MEIALKESSFAGNVKGTNRVLTNICGNNVTLREVSEAVNYLQNEIGVDDEEAEDIIVFGTANDVSMGNMVKIMVIAAIAEE